MWPCAWNFSLTNMNANLLRLHWLAMAAVFLLPLSVFCPRAAAQEVEIGVRFLFILRDPDPALRQLLVDKVASEGGTPGGDLFFPALGFIAMVGVFQQPVAIVDNDPRV